MTEAKKCLQCNNEATHTCVECKGNFCINDFMIHEQNLINEFKKLGEERNKLHEEVITKNPLNIIQQSLLSQIKKWHDVTVEKVHQAAAKTRDEVNLLLQQNMNNIKKELTELAEKLHAARFRDTIVESNMGQLRERVRRLRCHLEKPMDELSIEINVKQSNQIDWNQMIYVENKSNDSKVSLIETKNMIKCAIRLLMIENLLMPIPCIF